MKTVVEEQITVVHHIDIVVNDTRLKQNAFLIYNFTVIVIIRFNIIG